MAAASTLERGADLLELRGGSSDELLEALAGLRESVSATETTIGLGQPAKERRALGGPCGSAAFSWSQRRQSCESSEPAQVRGSSVRARPRPARSEQLPGP